MVARPELTITSGVLLDTKGSGGPPARLQAFKNKLDPTVVSRYF